MFESCPTEEARLETPRGEVRIRYPGHAIFHTWAKGHMDVACATFLRDAGNKLVARSGQMMAFHEWDQAETYDSDARKLLTDWGVALGKNVEKVHILFRSKLVAMGVSVAAVVLGGMIVSYKDRETFLKKLKDEVATRAPR